LEIPWIGNDSPRRCKDLRQAGHALDP
jgi:hypothetical protein